MLRRRPEGEVVAAAREDSDVGRVRMSLVLRGTPNFEPTPTLTLTIPTIGLAEERKSPPITSTGRATDVS